MWIPFLQNPISNVLIKPTCVLLVWFRLVLAPGTVCPRRFSSSCCFSAFCSNYSLPTKSLILFVLTSLVDFSLSCLLVWFINLLLLRDIYEASFWAGALLYLKGWMSFIVCWCSSQIEVNNSLLSLRQQVPLARLLPHEQEMSVCLWVWVCVCVCMLSRRSLSNNTCRLGMPSSTSHYFTPGVCPFTYQERWYVRRTLCKWKRVLGGADRGAADKRFTLSSLPSDALIKAQDQLPTTTPSCLWMHVLVCLACTGTVRTDPDFMKSHLVSVCLSLWENCVTNHIYIWCFRRPNLKLCLYFLTRCCI